MTASATLPSSVQDLTLDLTNLAHTVCAAATLLAAAARNGGGVTLDPEWATTIRLWEDLTGLSGDAALEVAQAISRHPLSVTAVVLPF